MRIIGLHGKAGAGKDTFADRLVLKHGFVKAGFSDALYEEVAASFGAEVTDLQSRERKEVPTHALRLRQSINLEFVGRMMAAGFDIEAPRSPREVLQLWGTEFRRAQSKTYWLERMSDFVAALDPRYRGVAIRDVRFENEAEWIRARGGKIYEIVRPSAGTPHAHVSEQRLPDHLIDVTVTNATTLDWLHFCADFSGYMDDELWASR